MKKRLLISLTVIIGICVIALLMGPLLHPEPVYRGKRISVWIGDLKSARGAGNPLSAFNAFLEMGSNAVPYLVKELNRGPGSTRLTSSRSYARLRSGLPQVISQYLPPLASADPAPFRNNVALALLFLWPVSDPALPPLTKCLKDKNWTKRQVLLYRFRPSEMNPKVFGCVSKLIDLLRDENPSLRILACEGLGYIGSNAKAAVPSLIELLHDTNYELRQSAAFALDGIGPEARAAVPELVGLLKDSMVKGAAAQALGAIGLDAKAAVPALLEAVNDTDYATRMMAKQALRRIDPEMAAEIKRQ
ncbi:MAG: hypothetical protein DME26_08005 [Verrucomicrobia bacterium]|nr:MAG: hypothetical protein DME26_08005 [Verrucomicrobiota bacterium]